MFICVAVFLGFFVKTVEAGLFSAFSSDKKQETVKNENLQTMPLLSVRESLDPRNNSTGGGDIVIVEDSALLAENDGIFSSSVDYVTSDKISLYEVKEGDNLSSIGKMFAVSANTIRWANGLGAREVIKPGQILTILPINGIKYSVKSGDTLKSIASSFKGDIDEIAIFNGIASDTKLAIGTEIIIPNGEPKEIISAPRTPSSNPDAKTIAKYSGPEYKGYYIRPIVGGRRTQGVHGNNGVDLAAPTGTPILASASGVVIVSRNSGWNGGYGKYVVIRHDNGTQTLYGHMNETASVVGQYVNQGQTIGYLGNTGRSTGPHVHFEIRGAKNPF